MLAAAGSLFGLFLLCSLYLQNVLGMGPLATGLAFIPLALSAGVGAHGAGHLIARHGVRGPLAGAFAVAAIGMALLSRIGDSGSTAHTWAGACQPRRFRWSDLFERSAETASSSAKSVQ